MFISSVILRNFRCFTTLQLSFEAPVVLIEGANGSGKTSLVEALSFACLMRSFRTHIPRELIHFGAEGSLIHVVGHGPHAGGGEPWEIKLTLLPHQKHVLANGAPATSYRELFDLYRAVVLTVYDIELVAGPPEERRLFIDQGIILKDPSYATQLKSLRKVLRQRGALLARGTNLDRATYEIWTAQLNELSKHIRARRETYLKELEEVTHQLSSCFLGGSAPLIHLAYAAHDEEAVTYEDEVRARRSLRGAHLDDLRFFWDKKPARRFASRGQQKLLVTLVRCAQRELLGSPSIFFVDDFMTDFDEEKCELLLPLLCRPESQIIFTTPVAGLLAAKLKAFGVQQIQL